jgi:hypothetical protein
MMSICESEGVEVVVGPFDNPRSIMSVTASDMHVEAWREVTAR